MVETLDYALDAIVELQEENKRLRVALKDAIDRPKGVVPDSALEFYKDGGNDEP